MLSGLARQPVADAALALDQIVGVDARQLATSQYSTPMMVYDSLGTSHVLTLHFQKTAANQWTYNVTIPGEEVTGGTAGTPFDIVGASGTLTFGSNGKLTDPAWGAPIAFTIPGLADGASDNSRHIWCRGHPFGERALFRGGGRGHACRRQNPDKCGQDTE